MRKGSQRPRPLRRKYFNDPVLQKEVGGQTRQVLIGRYPVISAGVARQTALGFGLELEGYLARSKLRHQRQEFDLHQQFKKYLKDWIQLHSKLDNPFMSLRTVRGGRPMTSSFIVTTVEDAKQS
jgi:hypothetical protein